MSEQKLIIVRGLSGSGKSTWTLNYIKSHDNAVRVNRDSIRSAYFGTEEAYGVNEALVTRAQNNLILCALSAGCTVVVDNTNIDWAHVLDVAQLAHSRKAKVEIHEIDCTLEEAQLRNINRAAMGGRLVPAHVIDSQHERYEQTKGWTL